MKRLLGFILLLSFVLWVMPLGAFIKPSQEKVACDGQRAMCMCHALRPQSIDKAMPSGLVLKTGAPTIKENPDAGHHFISTKPHVNLNAALAIHFENQFLSYKNPYLAALEYVPKF